MPTKKNKSTSKDSRSRMKIIEHLKRSGPQDAQWIAERVGTSAMAVRQHLYQLQEEEFVTFREEPRPVGRPAKLWELTERANRFFPDTHAHLTLDLIGFIKTALGNDGLDKVIGCRLQQQIESYQQQIPSNATIKEILEVLVKIRSEEGYMAELEKEKNGSWLLIENHCPICFAATGCSGLCSAELDVFKAILGEGVNIERIEHIPSGEHRCVYRIVEKDTD